MLVLFVTKPDLICFPARRAEEFRGFWYQKGFICDFVFKMPPQNPPEASFGIQ